MPETAAANNQLPPRTHVSHRWPRKWATLGGRGAPSTTIPPLDEIEAHGKSVTNSIFRKSSTISRTTTPKYSNNVEQNSSNNESSSLKKSRSLINVLRSKLNSPAVLRRFRTKSRDNGKQTVTEIVENPAPTNNDETSKKHRKRDPSPMHRLTTRLAQLTRSSTHNTINPTQEEQDLTKKPSQDQVDQINACYDEIRAKYFEKSNGASLPACERLKEMLSTTTTSSIDYYDRPNLTNGEQANRSLSTISINGSLLSHELLNNSQQCVPSPPPSNVVNRQPDDPLLMARKQSNIKLNCMLSGYLYKNPFGNQDRLFGQNDIFKFHHYHDVGKRKFDIQETDDFNRTYSSMRARPISRSIDSVRRATTTIPTNIPEPIQSENNEQKALTSKIHVEPAAPVLVKTFISSTSASNNKDDEFERNFLRAVDRALALTNSDVNNLLQPIYDTPINKDICQEDDEKPTDDDLLTNGNESPNVELLDRTGDLFLENEQQTWQSSALYEEQQTSQNNENHHVHQTELWPIIEKFAGKNQDFITNELKNGQEFLVTLNGEEKLLKNKADSYGNILSSEDQRISEEIRSEIQAVIGEANLLIGGKLKQFRGLCQSNISKTLTSDGEPTPLDSDLAGFWDITQPLINRIKEKFTKLDACQSRSWTVDENEFDPADVNRRPKKSFVQKSKLTLNKSSNEELKKLIEQRRKAAANNATQTNDVEIFHVEK